jgi:hypothetical protein
MACPAPAGTRFANTSFDLEPLDGYRLNACWTFANQSAELATAQLAVHYSLREIKNGFVTFSRNPLDTTPIFISQKAACVCSADSKVLIAYFVLQERPSYQFFAKRGDVIEIEAEDATGNYGLPPDCARQLTTGKYHVLIQHIYPFEQPAAYQTIIIGEITTAPLTDVSGVFKSH